MSGIKDNEVPCCSKDVRREDENLLQKFVPVNVYSESSVRRMTSQKVSARRVTTYSVVSVITTFMLSQKVFLTGLQ